jgi:hypothetical protein
MKCGRCGRSIGELITINDRPMPMCQFCVNVVLLGLEMMKADGIDISDPAIQEGILQAEEEYWETKRGYWN